MLSRHLRTHLIVAPSTSVGKSIFATGLCRASLSLGERVGYLKPVGTGSGDGDDELHIRRFASKVTTACLFHFDEPVSPHLAAQRASTSSNSSFPTDDEFIAAVGMHVQTFSTESNERSAMYIESAGGVHSPTLTGSSQLDAFRPLLPPTLLIASHQLGGISTTISAYESLILRGYNIDSALIFREDYYRNFEYLQKWFEERGISMGIVDQPPPIVSNTQEDQTNLEAYYASISETSTRPGHLAPLQSVVEHLQNVHLARLDALDSAPRQALDKFWWPFCQHGLVTKESDVMVIDSAHRDFFNVYNPNQVTSSTNSSINTSPSSSPPPPISSPPSLLQNVYDGSASWWTQCLGHANSQLTLAASFASGRYGHILFPSAASLPSLNLASRLLSTVGKKWASRVFYSDDGSTGMEVGLKMALRAFAFRNGMKSWESRKLAVLGLKGSYHGDTIGAMDACEGAVFNERVEWYEGRGFWLDCPSVRIEKGITTVTMEKCDQAEERKTQFKSLSAVYSVEDRLMVDPLVQVYTDQIEGAIKKRYEEGGPIQYGVLVLEPVVMGAGGMIFVDPLFQRILIDIVRTNRNLFPDIPSSPSLLPPSDGTPNWSGLPIIFDEVFVGLRRLGRLTTSTFLGSNTLPDIACYAKILTGGLVPMAVTMASNNIFQSFWGEKKVDALLHGHSYSAHPVGCEVANRALEIMDQLEQGGKFDLAKSDWKSTTSSTTLSTSSTSEEVWSFWSQSFISQLSHLPNVAGVMSLGTVLAIHLVTPSTSSSGYQSTVAESLLLSLRHGPSIEVGIDNVGASPNGLPFNIHARPLGNVVYFMSSLNSNEGTLRAVEGRLLETIRAQEDVV